MILKKKKKLGGMVRGAQTFGFIVCLRVENLIHVIHLLSRININSLKCFTFDTLARVKLYNFAATNKKQTFL